MISKSCHLIGQKHFGLTLIHVSGSRFFPDMGFVHKYSKIIQTSIIDQILKKTCDQIFQLVQKSYFWFAFPNFGANNVFFKKKSDSLTHNFVWVSNIMLKRKLKIPSQEHARTDRRTEGSNVLIS